MKKTNKLFAIIAIIAVIGFAAVLMFGCSSSGGGDNSQTEKTVESIEVTPPTKLHYDLGEDLDLTGMVVTATYEDGTEAEVTDYKIDGYVNTKTGHQVITVTYKGKTAEFSVNVVDPNKPTVTLTANPPAGTYNEEKSVTLTANPSDAVIYYTTDGSEPTEESDVYTSAIPISVTTTIRAFAVKEGYNDSDELEAEYILILPFTSAPELTLEPDNGKITYSWVDSVPVADSYDVYWKAGDNLSAAELKTTGTKITPANSGDSIGELTNDTAYSFIVTANKAGYTSIDSEVETATPSPPYIITGTSTFTATQSSNTIGTANQPIQTVIDAVKSHANGKAVIIYFGDGTNTLDIGTTPASFNNTSGTWGKVELSGKITGSSTTATSGTIVIAGDVSVSTISMTGGTVSTTATSGRAIHNNSTGAVTISGGTVSATGASAYSIYNNSTGVVTVTSPPAVITGARYPTP